MIIVSVHDTQIVFLGAKIFLWSFNNKKLSADELKKRFRG